MSSSWWISQNPIKWLSQPQKGKASKGENEAIGWSRVFCSEELSALLWLEGHVLSGQCLCFSGASEWSVGKPWAFWGVGKPVYSFICLKWRGLVQRLEQGSLCSDAPQFIYGLYHLPQGWGIVVLPRVARSATGLEQAAGWEESSHLSPALQRDSKGCNVSERKQEIPHTFHFKTPAPTTGAKLFAAFVLP